MTKFEFKEKTLEQQKDCLEKAIVFACHAHLHQKDKVDMPYILHPLSVMNKCETLLEKTCAVLHDVVEDTEFNLEHIDKMFGPEVACIIDALSRRDGEVYKEYIERLSNNGCAVKIKLFDIEDNSRKDRLGWADGDKLSSLMSRYEWANEFLIGKMS